MAVKEFETANFRPVKVMCYAGYRGSESPRQVARDNLQLEVTTVLRRWREPAFEYTEVLFAEGSTALLRHALDQGDWTLAWPLSDS